MSIVKTYSHSVHSHPVFIILYYHYYYSTEKFCFAMFCVSNSFMNCLLLLPCYGLSHIRRNPIGIPLITCTVNKWPFLLLFRCSDTTIHIILSENASLFRSILLFAIRLTILIITSLYNCCWTTRCGMNSVELNFLKFNPI